MLGELIVLDRGVRSLALLGGACRFICRCACHHFTPCTSRRSLSPLADSCPGALAAASLLNWWMYLMVLRSCTSGTVIVCGRGCLRLRYGHPPLWKSLLRRRQISYSSGGNIDWKGFIRKTICSCQFAFVNCHRSCIAWDHRVWIGILLGRILRNVTSKQICHCNRHCNLCRTALDLVSWKVVGIVLGTARLPVNRLSASLHTIASLVDCHRKKVFSIGLIST